MTISLAPPISAGLAFRVFGAGALRRMGEEARRMSDEMGRVFGEG
jgi:hypothetical protein